MPGMTCNKDTHTQTHKHTDTQTHRHTQTQTHTQTELGHCTTDSVQSVYSTEWSGPWKQAPGLPPAGAD